jgi:hypothetical protein
MLIFVTSEYCLEVKRMVAAIYLTSGNSDSGSSNKVLVTQQRRRCKKIRQSDAELVQIFWAAPMEALFGQSTIAPVIGNAEKTLEQNRWRGVGVPYKKISGKVLYRKSDVVAYLENYRLVSSTSEYEQNGGDHNA